MPSHKPVTTLQSLCLSTITKHRKKDSNPFAKMPNCILDKVLNHPDYVNHVPRDRVYYCVAKQYCDNLGTTINQFTTRLDFTEKSHRVVRRGVELICKMRPKITHLNLSNSLIDIEHLKELSRCIPNIQSLQLNSTQTTDEVLAILGQNCPDLRELDISNCKITDNGIYALCNTDSRLIRKLHVSGTMITDKGAIMVMRMFRQLRHFDYDNILWALEAMYKQCDLSTVRFQLQTINQRNRRHFPITNFTLDVANAWCPNITNVKLLHINSNDNWVIKLANFSKLTNLALVGSTADDGATFRRHIAPMLKIIGRNLKTLFLSQIKDIDLWSIGRYCDHLKSLFLSHRNRYVSSIPFVTDFPCIFSKLRYVVINCEENNDIPVDQLECLLSNCIDVEILRFSKCQTLTDDVLIRVLNRNSFSKLAYFKISQCNNIQMTSLGALVKLSKSLNSLIYEHCANIRPDDHRELRDLIEKENLDLVIPREYVYYNIRVI